MDNVTLLTVNAGSSSVRLAVFRCTPQGPERIADARHEGNRAGPEPIQDLLAQAPAPIRFVAHRVVHGGGLRRPTPVDDAVRAELERLAPLAPLHNPPALRWIEVCRTLFGAGIPQIAVFDTAFFVDLPARATTYGLPRALVQRHGLRRYGFHGIAHEAMWRAWCARRPDLPRGGRIVTLQLGAGCSISAIDGGRAVDTSMGFTPLEGLLMATRSGDVDPGVLIHLLRREGLDADALERVLAMEGGLAGISGRGGDVRELVASDDPDSRLALEVYCYRAKKYVGAYLAALGGADGIVFGGGVGEHQPVVRARVLAGLEALGIVLDRDRNAAVTGEAALVSAPDSAVEVLVQPVDEAGVIARDALEVWMEQGGARPSRQAPGTTT